eukprot:GAHX01001287.1.p1 GENE.GAHX01001287.1~~GAHX01001287.1.p1  ORF type:complete len:175 (-),score=22.47 GAHX01001287.1:33-512(-)
MDLTKRIFNTLKQYYYRSSALFSTFTYYFALSCVFYAMIGITSFYLIAQPKIAIKKQDNKILALDLDFDFTSSFNYNVKQIYFSIYAISTNEHGRKVQQVIYDRLILRSHNLKFKGVVKPTQSIEKRFYKDDAEIQWIVKYEAVPYIGILLYKEIEVEV